MRIASRAVIIKNNELVVMHRNKFGMEYYSLPGGGVDLGETPESALYREIDEETSITISNPKLIIIEDAGYMYGIQYIFLCQYERGEPNLSTDSPEAQITKDGKNIYQPMWIAIDKIPDINLLPTELKPIIINGFQNGFAEDPIKIKINS